MKGNKERRHIPAMFLVVMMVVSVLAVMPVATANGNAPPNVVCVPWVGTNPAVPHDTWNGNTVVLKGTAHDPDGDAELATYEWDFGDASSKVTGTVTNPYAIEATHVYPVSPDGTPYTATLTVWDTNGASDTDAYPVIVRTKTLDVEVNVAIDDGLWWLHEGAYRSSSGGIDYARWSSYGGYYTSATAETVLAFEMQGHQPIGNPDEDPYVETVQRGLNYVFSQTRVASIGNQPAGDPDTNGNGKGIGVSSSREPYEIGMVMMAIAASGDPTLTANTGPTGVIGSTYEDILTDMVDMCAWGQNDYGGARGGWRYAWNYGSSDNSVTQWPIIGLEAAENNWGITAPGFVKTELDTYWLTYSQNADGSFGYGGPGGSNIARTGTGICGLNYVGLPASNSRVVNAVNWLSNHWAEFGNYYGMYAVMKGMRTANPEITMVGTHDWYAEYARYIVDDQYNDGHWYYGYGNVLATDWAILILTPSTYRLPPVADAGSDQTSGPGWPVNFDGSGSFHLDPTKSIVKYEWDFESDGTYDATGMTVSHTYPAHGDYIVTLRVTDDNVPPLTDTDTCTVHITPPPHPPVADPDGPYTGCPDVPVTLDGTGSFDIDTGDSIVSYGWELDMVAPYDFDDATGPTPQWTWASAGTYNIGLKVEDTTELTDTAWTTVEIDEKYCMPTLCPDEYRWGSYNWDPFPATFVGRQEVRFVNSGTGDAYNVIATVTCTPINVVASDPGVTLGDIPAGGSAWSSDTFELRVDMTNPQDPNKGICYRVEYDDAAGVHHTIEDVAKFCGEDCSDICP
jgi:hypothetical protein